MWQWIIVLPFLLVGFWSTLSPSLGLVILVFFSLSSSMLVYSYTPSSGIGLILMCLILIGGLFILISYTILSYPWDLHTAHRFNIYSGVTILPVFFIFQNLDVKWTHLSPSESFNLMLKDSIHGVILILLLLILLVFLFVIDALIKHKGGTFLFPDN